MESWKSRISFKTWIMRYKNKDNPMGDLARDIADDRDFPDGTDLAEISLYLVRQNPCPECIKVFRTACKRYLTFVMKEMWGDA